MRAAMEAASAQPYRGIPGAADPERAGSHVRGLIDAGMTPETIAALGGLTPHGVGMLLRGEMVWIPTRVEQQILAIEIPSRDSG